MMELINKKWEILLILQTVGGWERTTNPNNETSYHALSKDKQLKINPKKMTLVLGKSLTFIISYLVEDEDNFILVTPDIVQTKWAHV